MMAYTLCDGKLISVSPMYIIVISVLVLSFITGLIITIMDYSKRKKEIVSNANMSNDVNKVSTTIANNIKENNIHKNINNNNIPTINMNASNPVNNKNSNFNDNIAVIINDVGSDNNINQKINTTDNLKIISNEIEAMDFEPNIKIIPSDIENSTDESDIKITYMD